MDFEKHPIATSKRISAKLILEPGISRDDLVATLIGSAFNEIKNDPDLDEILLFAYDRRNDVSQAYTLAKLEWAVDGRWGATDPDTASANDRSSYTTTLDIKPRVGAVVAESDRPTQQQFAIYDAVNRKIESDDRVLNSNDMQATAYALVASDLNLTVEEVSAAWTAVSRFNTP